MTMPDPMPKAASATHDRLLRAAELVDVPCRVAPALWTSDHAHDEAEAARACRACPVLRLCREHVDAFTEAAGVWAGTTPRQRRTAARTGVR